jgi:hypothetical protein
MSCEVCIGGNIDELYEDYSRELIFAESSQTCEECRAGIAAGTDYELASGEYNGKRYNHITCLTCVEIRDVFSCGEAVGHGGLWEDMRDYGFPELTTASECFQGLSPQSKLVVLAKWQQWKGLR